MEESLPGPQQYVECRSVSFGLLLKVLGHYVAYCWGPGTELECGYPGFLTIIHVHARVQPGCGADAIQMRHLKLNGGLGVVNMQTASKLTHRV